MHHFQEIHTPSATYKFRLYPVDTEFKRIAGLYTFIILPTNSPASQNHYTILYIGITNDFKARFKSHHKLDDALELGCTHIGIMRKSSGRTRKKIEKDLLQYLNPPLNQTWL